MEKLQHALEIAREQRRARDPNAPPNPAGSSLASRGRGRADSLQAAWQGLEEITLDKALLKKNRIMSMEAGRESTTFDILRTKVQLMMQKNQWTRLAVTSPTPSCGKTTTACNLVLGLSRQEGIRAVLVELDLSRPMVAKMLGFEPKFSITEMLSGEVPFEHQAVRIRSNVAIAATRRSASDPTSVLLSQTTLKTLAQIEETYAPDIVIFDLPPLLVSDETRAFLSNVDCALMLAKAERTTTAQIDFCEKEIAEHTNVLGLVLNECRHVDELNSGYDSYYYKS
jgi:protein-tyrosine kinase